MENDLSNIGEYINCYNKIKGYYLDKKDSLFKKCYDTCEICEIKGDNITHNCLICNENYAIKININNYSNCYKICSYYYYIDNNNYYYCTDNFSCPYEYPILLQNKNECIKLESNFYETSEIILFNTDYIDRNNSKMQIDITTNDIIEPYTNTQYTISYNILSKNSIPLLDMLSEFNKKLIILLIMLIFII